MSLPNYCTRNILALAVAGAAVVAGAVPARQRPAVLAQSDGTALTVVLHGDEWHSWLSTADGLTLGRDAAGDCYYKIGGQLTPMLAHDADQRRAVENAFVDAYRRELTEVAVPAEATVLRAAAGPSRASSTQVPVTGAPRVPILLVDYTDKAMAHNVDDFVAQYTVGPRSVYQYFVDQSWGQYRPQFDVYGIYHLQHTRATYGAHGMRNGREINDVGVGRMVGDAIDLTGDEVDWSVYDNDGDGQVDVCIVVYAGVGEAQGYIDDSVWPCQWNLWSAAYYGDGTGTRSRNGKTINRFAVFNELFDRLDDSDTMDGIGTFCHEFSHCLGLPDFYETTYANGYYGMGNWSLMCGGCYNDDSYTPCAYTAYERAFMGWMSLDELTPGTDDGRHALATVDDGHTAFRLTNDANSNEYYVLENIERTGWNAFAPAEGLMVTHVTYSASAWQANTVNNSAMQRMTIIAADNHPSDDDEASDLYPWQGNDSLTDTSTPPAALNLGGSRMSKPITQITRWDTGAVTLVFGTLPDEPAGDVNGDGTVDTADVNLAVNLILGIDTDPLHVARADVDGNKTVDVADVNAIISTILIQ